MQIRLLDASEAHVTHCLLERAGGAAGGGATGGAAVGVAVQLLLGSSASSLRASLQTNGLSAQQHNCTRRLAITQAAACAGAIRCAPAEKSAPHVLAQPPDACRWTYPACSVPSLWPAAWVLPSACPTAMKVGAHMNCFLPAVYMCCCQAVQGCAGLCLAAGLACT